MRIKVKGFIFAMMESFSHLYCFPLCGTACSVTLIRLIRVLLRAVKVSHSNLPLILWMYIHSKWELLGNVSYEIDISVGRCCASGLWLNIINRYFCYDFLPDSTEILWKGSHSAAAQCYFIHRHLNNAWYNKAHSLNGKPFLVII